MSLKPQTFDPVPAETARVAKAAFLQGNVYMQMRDAFGTFYADEAFAPLFSRRGQPGASPACLALVTVMQFAEHLSDRQAANAVRGRIDWKYALGLELTDPGFDASVLSEFRTRLLAGQAEATLFDLMLKRFREAGLLKAGGQQRTDSTPVLAAIQTLNRLECIGETMRRALNVLAVVVPAWLREQVPAAWFDRYGQRCAEYRLPPGRAERYALAETIGTDGLQLMDWIYAPSSPYWLRDTPAVEILRQVWVQQFYTSEGILRWRPAENLPPSSVMICSPYDAEARYSKKRSTEWTGYRVHLTETCDDDAPHLITDVHTTPAPVSDFDMLPTIQAALATRDVLPAEQIVDAGYVTADHLVASQKEHGVTLLGPVNPDASWQAKAQQGFDVASFVVDWDTQTVTCPNGCRPETDTSSVRC
jgi:transposase